MTNEIGNQMETQWCFDNALEAVKNEVERNLSSSPLIIREYTRHLMLSGGKYIRAASLLTCALDEQNCIHQNAVSFASAIEIMHLATLVHDDVIDDARIRRGVATLQKKFGKRAAVICGDYLLCVALRVATDVPNKQDYAEYTLTDYIGRVCLGELNQHINNGNLGLSMYSYLKIIRGKTAALFEGSFLGGAILCTDDQREIKRYVRLGRYIGMIFQLADDCIDFEKDEQSAKKPVQSDFEQGIITLPLIYALKNQPQLREKAESHQATRSDVNEAVARSGGLDFTRLVAKNYYNKAKKIITALSLTLYKEEQLLAILDKSYAGLAG